jgi:hypothetical protein
MREEEQTESVCSSFLDLSEAKMKRQSSVKKHRAP